MALISFLADNNRAITDRLSQIETLLTSAARQAG